VWYRRRTQHVHPLVVSCIGLTYPVWYFFNDVYPPLHNGHSPLDPPAWWVQLFDRRQAPIETPENEEFREAEGELTAGPDAAVL